MKCDWCPPTTKTFTRFPCCFQLYPGKNERTNPGNIQELHGMARRIMPKFFDGVEVDYVHRLSSNKIITTNWLLSHTRPSGFRFGGIYTMRVQDDIMQTPTVHADINPSSLASNFGVLYYPFNCLRLEALLQRAGTDTPLTTQLTAEITRPCATITANYYTYEDEKGRGTLSFMRSITAHWAIGAELLLEWPDANSLMADTAFAARYSTHNYAVAASASRQGVDISYWQRIHSRIQMGTTMAWQRKTKDTYAAICYQWDFKDAVVRGVVQSDLSVGFMYQRSLSHIPCGFGVSLLMNIPTNKFVFGIKFNLDPSGLKRGD
ncbi:mitochondrial import receptor subunit TOM40 homolog 2 [Teleopsis dalmanni]|uniref:mitochondrial import receptor subunit TOM40 homolog 2 n=1 Tax=Teleopsis dalmanni TaxID=139649 RepID=UPI000D32A09E|nr:mitochondrial import receptor subunit TOM40 homolog 2 [Teleopsis dalmanni]